MAKIVQHRRLTKAENATYTGPIGEIIVISDDGSSLRVHDGVNPAGKLSSPAALSFSNLAALKANSLPAIAGQIATTAGWTTPGDGGGNRFYVDSTDTTTVGNDGSVIVDALNRRWKQTSPVFDVKQWGAKGDGTTDDKAKIQIVINAAVSSTGFLVADYVANTGSQTEADPGSGNFLWNSVGQADATELYVDSLSSAGTDITTQLLAVVAGRVIHLRLKTDATRYQDFTVVSVTNMTGWVKYVVTPKASAGAAFANSDNITLVALGPVTGLLEALEERRDDVVTPVDAVTPLAVNAPNHIVYLSPGIYRTTGMMVVKDGTWIVGEGRSSIIKPDFAVAGSGALGNITGQVGFVKLQNFCFLSERTDGGTALYCKAVSDSEFYNLQILRTSPTHGFSVAITLGAPAGGEGSYRNRFEHCRFEVRGGTNTFGVYGDGGAAPKGPNGTVFDTCYFLGGDDANPGTLDSTYGAQIHHTSGGVLFIGCTFEGAITYGVDLGATSVGCAVIGNRINITGGGTTKRGIRINGNGHAVMGNNLSTIVSVTERLEIVGVGNHAVLGAESGLTGGALQRIVGNLSTGLIPANPVGNAGGLNTFLSIFNNVATQGTQSTEKVGLIVRNLDGVTNRGGLFYFDGTTAALKIATIVATGAAQPIQLLVGVDKALEVDANLTANETRLLIGEGATPRRVSIGATDSAGTGFRQLRIPNGP
jgi:hypothetical protein